MAKGGIVHWIHMGSWGMYVGYTSSPEAFERAVKRLKVKPVPSFLSGDHAGATTHFFDNPNKWDCALICIDLTKPAAKDPIEIAGIVVHEVSHVILHLWKMIGEREPGHEAQAYLFQYLVMRILIAMKSDREGGGERDRKTAP